jgi:hypothetical protein
VTAIGSDDFEYIVVVVVVAMIAIALISLIFGPDIDPHNH